MTRPLVLVALLLALVGCGAPTTVAPQSTGAETAVVGAEGVIPAPVAVSIPAVGATSSLIPLGLDAGGALVVPPLDQPMQAGWYEPGVIPGQSGPAVIAAHVSGRVDGQSVPGVFARLSELVAGDEVWIDRASASPLEFVVHLVQRYDKDEFPTAQVYGDVPGPELRLITCGGDFDPGARSYEDNVVVYAHLRP